VTTMDKLHFDRTDYSVIVRMKQLTCKCGAIYEVTENEVPFKGPYRSAKCFWCESELTWIGHNPQFHLIKQPDQDRE
jgi:hypothetical protein